MSIDEFKQLAESAFADVDLTDEGVVVYLKTQDGIQQIGISSKTIEKKSKKGGINKELFENAQKLPPKERKRIAMRIMYNLLQDENFKKTFFSEMKKRGVINIPDTQENIAFITFLKYAMIGVIIGVGLLFVLTLAGVIS